MANETTRTEVWEVEVSLNSGAETPFWHYYGDTYTARIVGSPEGVSDSSRIHRTAFALARKGFRKGTFPRDRSFRVTFLGHELAPERE
jgi:hypothetical protein